MKKTLLKSLLVAAMAVTATSAWADKTVANYTFDNANSPTLTAGSKATLDYSNVSVVTNTNFLSVYGQNANHGNTDVVLTSDDLSAEQWTLEFYLAFYAGCNGYKGISTLQAGQDTLFYVDEQANWSGDFTMHYGDESVLLPSCGMDRNTRGAGTGAALNSTDYWYKFTLTGTPADGVYLTVEKTSTSEDPEFNPYIVNKVQLSTSNITPTLITLRPGGLGSASIDELKYTYYYEGAVSEKPTYLFSAVKGNDRVYTLTNINNDGGSLFYTTAPADEAPAVGDAAYTEVSDQTIDVTFSESGTYYMYALLADGVTASDIVPMEIETGWLKLKAATWARNDDGNAVLTSNQNDVIGRPTGTIMWALDEDEFEPYEDAVEVPVGSTLNFFVHNDDYINSDTVSVLAAPENTNTEVFTETYYSANNSLGIGVDNNGAAAYITEDGTKLYYILKNPQKDENGNLISSEGRVSDYLVSASTGISNWLYRNNGIYGGNTQNYGVLGVQQGDYVIIDTKAGSETPNVTVTNADDGEKDLWNSTALHHCFNVTGTTGVLRFTIGRYGYVNKITVLRNNGIQTMTVLGDLTGGWEFESALQMELDETTGKWTATVDAINLEAGKEYQYKAAANGAWGVYELPMDGNQTLTVDKSFEYKLTFTADVFAHQLTVDAAIHKDTFAVKFVNVAEWDSIYAYSWRGNEGEEGFEKISGDWPGVRLACTDSTEVDGVKYGVFEYKLIVPEAPEFVIFNDAATNQTENLVYKNDSTYILQIEKLATYTAKFVNGAGWEKVYAFTWTGEEQQAGAWPGTELTEKEDVVINGVTYSCYTFSIDLTAAPENIIFNNGNGGEGNQTENLVFENGKTYDFGMPTVATFDFANNNMGLTIGDDDHKSAGDLAGQTIVQDPASLSFSATAAATYYYSATNGNHLQVKKDDVFMVSVPAGKAIKQIFFQYIGGISVGMTVKPGELTFDRDTRAALWTGNSQDVEFTVTAARNFSQIVVTYADADDDTITGIETVATQRPAQVEAIYNMAGQRVQNAQKGLYIVNGKKVVLK